MSWYPNTVPDWLSNWFPNYHWHGDRRVKKVYLTFDDGPTPVVTDYVLEQLAQYEFKATFFLIGDCVARHSDLKEDILNSGHRIGNHTFHHLNAWKTSTEDYLENVEFANKAIGSKLFRPPYGRITARITQKLRALDYKIVLWDVLSGDFDSKRSAASCLTTLFKSTRNGSVIVFHDSEKAFAHLKEILPIYFKWLREEGYKADVL